MGSRNKTIYRNGKKLTLVFSYRFSDELTSKNPVLGGDVTNKNKKNDTK